MIIEWLRLWITSLLYCRIGRRKAVLISSAGITLMIAAVALSPNVYAFMAFRFMAGFFTQALGSVAYCYGRSIKSKENPWFQLMYCDKRISIR